MNIQIKLLIQYSYKLLLIFCENGNVNKMNYGERRVEYFTSLLISSL